MIAHHESCQCAGCNHKRRTAAYREELRGRSSLVKVNEALAEERRREIAEEIGDEERHERARAWAEGSW